MDEVVEAVSATAKALEESAKTTGKVVDAGRELGGWFEGKLGRSIEDTIGLAIGDRLAFWRASSLVRRQERFNLLVHNTKNRLNLLGVESVKILSDGIAVPLLEAATLEEDETLQSLWANLLATALSDEDGIDRTYVSILAELSPTGALALNDYLCGTEAARRPPYKERGIEVEKNSLDGDLYGVDVARGLFRLGLIEPAAVSFSVIHRKRSVAWGDEEDETVEIAVPGDLYRIKLTELGLAFGRAVGIHVRP